MNYTFTESVQRILAAARDEAIQHGHDYVGPEHVLLALVRASGEDGTALLERAGARPEDLAARIEERLPAGGARRRPGELPYTGRAKRVLELALTAARDFNHPDVGAEQLLMGLAGLDEGLVVEVLREAGLTKERVQAFLPGAASTSFDSGLASARASWSGLTGWRRSRVEGNYRFTDRARKLIVLAREEAIRFRHDCVGTEHLLLGLLREGEGVAAAALREAAIGLDDVRRRVEAVLRPGAGSERVVPAELPYTSRAKRALEFAIRAAERLMHEYVGTEHILLGLLTEEEGTAAQVLGSAGLTLQRAEAAILAQLGGKPAVFSPLAFRMRLDDESDQSIYEQITSQVQEGVATGRLQPGERLPTVRQLADELDIAPGTVARAYSELERRGVVVTEGARGTRVADRSPLAASSNDLAETLSGLLRPSAVAAFHLGATASDLRLALERAMTGIFDAPEPDTVD